MNVIKTMVAALAIFGMASCCCNEPKEIKGTIADASMNTVTVSVDGVDTTYPIAEDADRTEAYGMLIGAPVTVTVIKDKELGEVATKVATCKCYSTAVGQWTMVDPINPEAVMGIDVQIQGVAQSINMETLTYKTWKMVEPGKIEFTAVSEGSGEPVEVIETGTITANEDGTYTLAIDGTEVVYTKAQ